MTEKPAPSMQQMSRSDRSTIKEIVHKRDRNRCNNCRRVVSQVETIDTDHVVPRGVGGSDCFSNLTTLCRQCHDAKHNEGIAPTVRFTSTGDMTDEEFRWFKQFLNEILPSLTRHVGVQLNPKFDLNDAHIWHLPLGDVRRLNRVLAKTDGRYQPLSDVENFK